MLKPAQNHSVGALTLFELLVVLGVIAVLASLLLAAFSNAKAKSTRTACLNNLKQINLGLRMYADENGDCLPNTNAVTSAYKELVKTYVGLAAPSSPNDRLFACPSDSFSVDSTQNVRLNGPLHETTFWDYSSYGFNGLNRLSDSLPGVAGKKLGTIRSPDRTILLAEASAFLGFSWHAPARPPIVNNARSVVSFVDGHVSYIPIYWDGYLGKTDMPMWYDPPAGYDYLWTALP